MVLGGILPNSNGEAAAEASAIMKNDAQGVMPVHTFDPDASPQEKGAQAAKGKQKLDSVKPNQNPERGALESLCCILWFATFLLPRVSTQGAMSRTCLSHSFFTCSSDQFNDNHSLQK